MLHGFDAHGRDQYILSSHAQGILSTKYINQKHLMQQSATYVPRARAEVP